MFSYKVKISYSNPLTQLIDVKLSISGAGNTFQLQLAAWRPGRYELQNYAQYVYALEAENGTVQKLTKDKWEVTTEGDIEIGFQFYAARMDAGSTWLDEEQLYVNFINFVPSIVGHEDQPIEVDFDVPSSYQYASALPVADNTLKASSYQELVDTPVIASAGLKHFEYSVMDTDFHIWICGNWQPDGEQLVKDFEAFTKVQLELFEGFPNKDYHFLIQALPYKYYHGVEHKNSTVITLGPPEELSDWKWYKELLGVSSHELFHCWNVTRIRPVEMSPYNFSKESYHNTGYVTEGLTTYYGDLMLRASGVFNDEQYLAELNTMLKRYFQNEGRKKGSLKDSSFDLWLDGYKLGAPNRKVSIYNEGALCALLLDLKIISSSNGLEALSSVMLDLWYEHGEIGRGYTEENYRNIVRRYFAKAGGYFDKYIDGVECIKEELEVELQKVGCELLPKASEDELEQIGVRTISKGESKEIIRIAEESEAAQKLMIGEVIISAEVLDESIRLIVSRKGVERGVVLQKISEHFSYYEIRFVENPTADQLKFRGKWLDLD